jgi:hypothetical protein
MTHFEGRDPAGPTLQDAEALLRSLVGVAAVRIVCGPNGAMHEVVVVPESESPGRQVVRNVTSALMARFGVDLHPDAITIAAPAADTVDHRNADPQGRAPIAHDRHGSNGAAPARERDQAPAKPARPAPDDVNGARTNAGAAAGTGNGANGHASNGSTPREPARNGAARGPGAGHDEPAAVTNLRTNTSVRPRLELVDLVRAGSSCRCRVIVAAGAERFVGVGDGEDDRIADIELAGRVAVDALRAARTPRDPIQFEGAVLVDIAGRAHVAVSLSVWTGSEFDTIAGAAPIHGSPAESAARAVIDSVVAHLIA